MGVGAALMSGAAPAGLEDPSIHEVVPDGSTARAPVAPLVLKRPKQLWVLHAQVHQHAPKVPWRAAEGGSRILRRGTFCCDHSIACRMRSLRRRRTTLVLSSTPTVRMTC